LKNTVELSKQQRNSEDTVYISPINVDSPIDFHLKRVGNDNDDISSEEHFEIQKPGLLLFVCPNI
jgi:hypothetical protein